MVLDEAGLDRLAVAVGAALLRRGWLLATAESCTGGWVAQTVTGVAGSSAWFDRGFVTYSNAAKAEMLGVDSQTLAGFGAVSEEVAREMARGALAHSRAQVALAISGIAGPSGGTPDKPVGTVCFAWATADGRLWSRRLHLPGDRYGVRRAAVAESLGELLRVLPPVT